MNKIAILCNNSSSSKFARAELVEALHAEGMEDGLLKRAVDSGTVQYHGPTTDVPS